jgi:hypothetical protein
MAGTTTARGGRRLRAVALCVALAVLQSGRPGVADEDAPNVNALVAQLADPVAAGAAEDALVKRGAEAVPALAALLKGPTGPQRAAAIRALGAIGADAGSAVSALSAIIVQPPRVKDRAQAAASLGRILVEVGSRLPRPASDVDPAIAAACDWLVRHQGEDGGWDCDGYPTRCRDTPCAGTGEAPYDVGVTGLAVLALLGGHGVPAEARRPAIDRAVAYLRKAQTADGFVGAQTSQHAIYNHGIATLALARACRQTKAADLREPVERAARVILRRQEASGGWPYFAGSGWSPDTPITAWMAAALAAAGDADIALDAAGLAGARKWIHSMTGDEKDAWRTGYHHVGGPPARTSEMQMKFPASLSLSTTACALCVRLWTRTDAPDPLIDLQAGTLAKLLPTWDPKESSIDIYYWMWGSQALRLRGPAHPEYRAWRKALVAALAPNQRKPADACARGSWDACDPWSIEGGRVYSTCAAVLALEACDLDKLPSPPGGAPALAVSALVRAEQDKDPELAAAARRAVAALRPLMQF